MKRDTKDLLLSSPQRDQTKDKKKGTKMKEER
jgi:hypothetical protein